MRQAVLVAEDEPAIAKLIEFKLSREGFDVTVARDGGEAIAKLTERKWDLAILDVRMPVKDGWEVLAEIRARPETRDLPVIMLSGQADEDRARKEAEGVSLGNTLCWPKPFAPEALAAEAKRMAGDEFADILGEFLGSFPERRAELVARAQELEEALSTGRLERAGSAALAIHVVVHRLAGAAGSYGFSALGSLAEALDDLLAEELVKPGSADLKRRAAQARLVAEALGESIRTGADAVAVASRADARELLGEARSSPG